MVGVYISGGISDVPEHRRHFTIAMAWLVVEQGLHVVNPLEVKACADERCGGGLVHKPPNSSEYVHTWKCYMRHDIRALLKCSTIAMIPGWETSAGARLEQYVALSCGLGIMYLPTVDQMAEALGVSGP